MSKALLKDRLREAMERANMKQVDLVNAGNFDKGQLSSWLSGKYQPKQTNIDKLSRILNVSEGWLMGYDMPMERKASEDAEHFGAFSANWNENHPVSARLSLKEFDLLKKYRFLDEHGEEMVDIVIDREYDRCENEEQEFIAIPMEELRDIPLAQRLQIEQYIDDEGVLRVARVPGSRRRKDGGR